MERHDLLRKLEQIEELAKDTLAEFPLSLTKARLRMIMALARYMRTETESSDPMSEPRLGATTPRSAPHDRGNE